MKVYVLVGIMDETNLYHEETNIGVFSSEQDAKSEVNIRKAMGSWPYDDWVIEEHDL